MNNNAKVIVGWVFSGLLGLLFLFSGIAKISETKEVVDNYEIWGLPIWFMQTVGLIEIIGSIGILIPKTRTITALGLICLMLGAVVIHLISGEFNSIIVNIGIIGVSLMLINFSKKVNHG